MAEDYAHIVDGVVVNVIVVEDPKDVPLDGKLIPLAKHAEGKWGIGWRWSGRKPVAPAAPATEDETNPPK